MSTIAKALTAGLTSLGGALVTALADGAVTPVEWVVVALAGLTALGAVYQVPNKTADR